MCLGRENLSPADRLNAIRGQLTLYAAIMKQDQQVLSRLIAPFEQYFYQVLRFFKIFTELLKDVLLS